VLEALSFAVLSFAAIDSLLLTALSFKHMIQTTVWINGIDAGAITGATTGNLGDDRDGASPRSIAQASGAAAVRV
jgi:hypothetical protein